VNTSNYSVEYGRSAGGVVNAVTKSGTNLFHGEAYFYDRDAEWGALNSFNTHSVQTGPTTYVTQIFQPKDVRKQYGIGIGGPIIKDKLFFFFALTVQPRLPGYQRAQQSQLFLYTSRSNATVRSDLRQLRPQHAGYCRVPTCGQPVYTAYFCRFRRNQARFGCDQRPVPAGFGFIATGISNLTQSPARTIGSAINSSSFLRSTISLTVRTHVSGGGQPSSLDIACRHPDKLVLSELRRWRGFGDDFVKDTFAIGKLDSVARRDCRTRCVTSTAATSSSSTTRNRRPTSSQPC